MFLLASIKQYAADRRKLHTFEGREGTQGWTPRSDSAKPTITQRCRYPNLNKGNHSTAVKLYCCLGKAGGGGFAQQRHPPQKPLRLPKKLPKYRYVKYSMAELVLPSDTSD